MGNIGALIMTTALGGLLYYNHNKEPPPKKNPILIIKAPILGGGGGGGGVPRAWRGRGSHGTCVLHEKQVMQPDRQTDTVGSGR